jgi:hypothetical protein
MFGQKAGELLIILNLKFPPIFAATSPNRVYSP